MSRKQEIARTWKKPLELDFHRCQRLFDYIEKKFLATGMSPEEVRDILEKDTQCTIAREAAKQWEGARVVYVKRGRTKNFENEMAFRVSARFGCSHHHAIKIVRAAFHDVREREGCTREIARQRLAESTRTDFGVFGITEEDEDVLYADDETFYADEAEEHP